MMDENLKVIAVKAFDLMTCDNTEAVEKTLNELTSDEAWLVKEYASRFYMMCGFVSETKEV